MAKVLVIEDDKIIATMLAKFLTNGGHDVFVAHDGKAGLRAITDEPPDVVVTDMYMPETDGIQAIRELRAHKPGLPIIAMSGGGASGPGMAPGVDVLDIARLLGAREVLKKPLLEKPLLDAVQRCLGA